MSGLPELSQNKVLNLVTLSCVLCLMLAVQSLGVMGAKFNKEPLPSTGAWELTCVLIASCVGAIVCWEVMKWTGQAMVSGCCGSRRSRELRRLREMARLATESEIERHWTSFGSSEEALAQQVQQAVATTIGHPRRLCSVGTQTDPEIPRVTTGAASSGDGPREHSPPRMARSLEPRPSPGAQSSASTTPSVDDDTLRHLDRERLCRDVVHLMTCEGIKRGLRLESMSISGLKPEIAARLATRLLPQDGFEVPGRSLPTDSQLKYVLWIWKHRKLQMRCSLAWENVSTRENISRWIHMWKDA